MLSNVLIILDQFTKFLVNAHIPKNQFLPIIDGFFRITHIRNPGVAFGLFSESPSTVKLIVFVVFSLVAIVAILVFFHQTPPEKKFVHLALILIFSGAIGNLIDRVMYHEVIDFLDFYVGTYHWPAFNIADSCITIGVVFMFADLIRHGESPKPEDSPDVPKTS